MKDALIQLNVKPREGGLEKEKAWNDPVMVAIPDLTGLSIEELRTQLVSLKLDIAGKGDKVVKQSPEPGTKVKEGSTIRIYLGD